MNASAKALQHFSSRSAPPGVVLLILVLFDWGVRTYLLIAFDFGIKRRIPIPILVA